VLHAIEGTASLFHCGDGEDHQGCLVQEVMTQAEQQMEDYLKERKFVERVDKNPGLSSMLNTLDRSLT
jgi:DNA-binding IscR family transcriptional regulator